MRGESESETRKWKEMWFKTTAEDGEGAAVTCDGKLFHRRAAATATGNALSPTLDRRVRRTSWDVDEAKDGSHTLSVGGCKVIFMGCLSTSASFYCIIKLIQQIKFVWNDIAVLNKSPHSYWVSLVTCDHSVTRHPTQVNPPRLNPSHAGRVNGILFSFYLISAAGKRAALHGTWVVISGMVELDMTHRRVQTVEHRW